MNPDELKCPGSLSTQSLYVDFIDSDMYPKTVVLHCYHLDVARKEKHLQVKLVMTPRTALALAQSLHRLDSKRRD
jgi:hypothetical protein